MDGGGGGEGGDGDGGEGGDEGGKGDWAFGNQLVSLQSAVRNQMLRAMQMSGSNGLNVSA